ncbi:MAG: hypothetical protein R3E31_15275 [Chloroflexota bacterium]
MDSKRTIQIRQSIRARLLTLILGLTILSIVIIGYVSINSILRAGQSAQVVSNDVLQQQAEDFLLQVTADNAAATASEFEDLRLDTDHIAQFIANVYSNPDDFAPHKLFGERRTACLKGLMGNILTALMSFLLFSFPVLSNWMKPCWLTSIYLLT